MALGLVSGLLLALATTMAAAQDKTPIKSQDDLPRHTYKLAGTATELLQSDEQFAALAKAVRADLEADLAKYQIEDASTLQRLYNVLVSLDVLEGHFAAALKGMARIRELETKEAKKLMSGLVGGPMSRRGSRLARTMPSSGQCFARACGPSSARCRGTSSPTTSSSAKGRRRSSRSPY
jgi:hypothetical protein